MTATLVRATGPVLLAGRPRWGAPARLTAAELKARCRAVDLRGRGGAGFPFADKLASLGRGRPVVVVNASEGEPASHKDATLVRTSPHLVLDGAVTSALATGAREVHLVTGPDRVAELEAAVRERGERLRFSFHHAAELFVAGQSSAVIELVAGRPGLPVTTWQPSTAAGLRGRPTLLSNAETFAVVGVLATAGPDEVLRHGTPHEPGTTLLTIDGDGPVRTRQVVEVAHGTPWADVLPEERLDSAVLLGGYHGTWAPPGALRDLTVSRCELAAAGLSLGAGVVLPADDRCPVRMTAAIVDHLASQSARRCGPCLNGLPALAIAFRAVVDGYPRLHEVRRLAGLVEGRGACAHPDGTVRLVRSLLLACPDEVDAHADGRCCR